MWEKLNFLLFFISLCCAATCVDGLCDDNNEPNWEYVQEFCKSDLFPHVEQYSNSLLPQFWHQFSYTINYGIVGDINTGKTTLLTTSMNKTILPEFYKENTCVPVFITANGSPYQLIYKGIKIQENITQFIIAANQNCQDSQNDTISAFRLTLEIPAFYGLNNDTNTLNERNISFIDIGGMNSQDTKRNKQLYDIFTSESDGIILMVNEANIRDKRFHEMMNRMGFLTHRPDILPENIFIVVNYLSRCTHDTGDYRTALDPPYTKERCVKVIERDLDELIDEYISANPQFENKFPKEQRIIVDLYDAKLGLQGDSEAREKSNWVLFSIAFTFLICFVSYVPMNKKIFSENMISLCELVTKQISLKTFELNTEIQKVSSSMNTLSEQLETLSQHDKLLEEEGNKMERELKQFVESFDNNCKIEDIGESMCDERDIQIQVNTMVERCKLSFKQIETSLATKMLFFQRDERLWFQNKQNIFVASDVWNRDSDIFLNADYIPFRASATSENRQIRSKEHCGKHWHGGAKQCGRTFSRYSNSKEDRKEFLRFVDAQVRQNIAKLQVFVKNCKAELSTQINELHQKVNQAQEMIQQLNNEKTTMEIHTTQVNNVSVLMQNFRDTLANLFQSRF